MQGKFFLSKREPLRESYTGKVEVFSRHCFFSSISQHKQRLCGFSRELCYRNLLSTIDFEKANLTFLLDTANGREHFLQREKNHPVIEIQEGSEAGAFLKLLQYVEQLNLHPETLLYFVEDDYIHRENWVPILLEGMQISGIDYATLYDHKDKYGPMYSALQSKIYATASCHWRETPSTTQTFAVRWKTLREDLSIHRKFSKGRKISADHQKFIRLSHCGRSLISPMPGYSTHAEAPFASPCIDWETLLQSARENFDV